MHNPITGMQYFLDGFGLITKPGLRRYVAIPLFINILIFVGLFFLLRHFMGEFNLWFASYLPRWLHWLSTVLWVLFFASFFLLFIYTFVTLANVVAAPFNSLLAEKVEEYLTGRQLVSRSLFENIKDVPRILGRQLAILGYYLPRAVLILILFFVPIVQTIAVFIWFIFNAWYLALTYIDYPTDNHQIPIRTVRTWLQARRGVAIGFGVSVMVASMIPGLNFFTVPAAVAGATKYWLEDAKSRQ